MVQVKPNGNCMQMLCHLLCCSGARSLCRKNSLLLRRLQWTMALRGSLISAYGSVLFDAACLLARMPPLFLLAATRKRIYMRVRNLRSNNEWFSSAENEIKSLETILLKRQWRTYLDKPEMPYNRLWQSGSIGRMERCHFIWPRTFLQELAALAHTYLGSAKMNNPRCEHCNLNMDSVEHTFIWLLPLDRA